MTLPLHHDDQYGPPSGDERHDKVQVPEYVRYVLISTRTDTPSAVSAKKYVFWKLLHESHGRYRA
jgi:hypothetical protein